MRDLPDRLHRRLTGSRRLSANRWTIEEAERHLQHATVEWAYVVDADGRQLFRRRGTGQTVFFAAEELPQLKDAVVAHNHPIGQGEVPEALTFSRTDVTFAVRFDVAEMRLVSPGWRFVLSRPKGGWPVDEDLMGAVFDETRAAVEILLVAAVLRREITDDERERRVAHETMLHLSSWGRFFYQRERA